MIIFQRKVNEVVMDTFIGIRQVESANAERFVMSMSFTNSCSKFGVMLYAARN